jgi:hypothetical protein
MAHPEQWIKSAIEASAGCDAYPMIAPEAAPLPFVAYARTSTNREGSLAAPLPVAIPPVATFSVEIYAGTYMAAKQLADDVRGGLHNFNGTADGVTILYSSLVEERDGDPVFFDGQDKPVFFVEHTYQVRWEE